MVDGTDNFPTRYLVNDAVHTGRTAQRLRQHLPLRGAGERVRRPDGPCYRCLHPDPPPPGLVPSCAEGGVLGVLAGRHRYHPGHRDAQADPRDRRDAGRPLADLRRAAACDSARSGCARIPIARCAAIHPTIRELHDYEAFCGMPAAAEADTTRRPVGDHRAGVEGAARAGLRVHADRRARAARGRDLPDPRREADSAGAARGQTRASSTRPGKSSSIAGLAPAVPRLWQRCASAGSCAPAIWLAASSPGSTRSTPPCRGTDARRAANVPST